MEVSVELFRLQDEHHVTIKGSQRIDQQLLNFSTSPFFHQHSIGVQKQATQLSLCVFSFTVVSLL